MVRHLSSATNEELVSLLTEAQQAIQTIGDAPPTPPHHLCAWRELATLVSQELHRRQLSEPIHDWCGADSSIFTTKGIAQS